MEQFWFSRLGLSGGGIFIVKAHKRMARKLRVIILLHLGLVSFRFHFGRTLKVFIFMIFGPSGRGHDSRKHQLTPNNSSESQIIFEKIWNLEILRIETFENVGKDAHREILEIGLINSWKFWIWDQYLQESMN